MEDWLLQVKESWNMTSDSQWYQSLRTEEKIKALAERPEGTFHPAVYDLIQKYIPELKGKKVLLPSSGDCERVRAFHRICLRKYHDFGADRRRTV